MSKFFNTGDVYTETKANRLFNNIGNAQRVVGLEGSTLSNITDSTAAPLGGFEYTITTGQTSGTITRVISRLGVKYWNFIKLNVEDLDSNNSLHYVIKDQDTIAGGSATTIVSSTEITSNQDNIIIDISTISRATYQNDLIIEFTLARDTTGDTSPMINNFSVVMDSTSQASEKFESGALTSAVTDFDIAIPKGYDEYLIFTTFQSSVDANGIEIVVNDTTTSNYSYAWSVFGDSRRYGISTSDTKFITANASAEGKITGLRDTEVVLQIKSNEIVGLGTGNTLIEARVWNTFVTTSIGRYEVTEDLEKLTLSFVGGTATFQIGTTWTVVARNY